MTRNPKPACLEDQTLAPAKIGILTWYLVTVEQTSLLCVNLFKNQTNTQNCVMKYLSENVSRISNLEFSFFRDEPDKSESANKEPTIKEEPKSPCKDDTLQSGSDSDRYYIGLFDSYCNCFLDIYIVLVFFRGITPFSLYCLLICMDKITIICP